MIRCAYMYQFCCFQKGQKTLSSVFTSRSDLFGQNVSTENEAGAFDDFRACTVSPYCIA